MLREDDRPDTLPRRGLRVRVAWTGAPALDGLGEAAGQWRGGGACDQPERQDVACWHHLDRRRNNLRGKGASDVDATGVGGVHARARPVGVARRTMERSRGAGGWAVPELAPRSSCFATLHKST